MTNNITAELKATAIPLSIEDLDLTPAGLADAPASELDLDSLVHTGNS
ncbi:hypothetical protein [Arthrobacter sp. ZGTC412]|nr:hypothetical protein [Arthrobacter sp. ZGTC412]